MNDVDFNIGLNFSIVSLRQGWVLIKVSLNIRSIRSQKGYNPVPPAIMMILPDFKSAKWSPSPFGQLKVKIGNFFLHSLINFYVNYPPEYNLNRIGIV